MFYINNILSLIFYKVGYFLITPKTYSFGGFYQTLFFGIKFSNLKKKKYLLVIGLINLDEKFFFNIYNLDLIKRVFLNYSYIEKLFCIILSLILNINLLILLFLRKIRLWKFFSNYIKFIFIDYIGYRNESEEIYEIKNNKNFFLQKIHFKYDRHLFNQKIDLSHLYLNNTRVNKSVAFLIKDKNYQIIKKISSSMCSNVNKCKNSIDYLIDQGFIVNRIGEPNMKLFSYSNKNYFDLCKKKKNQTYLNNTIANCEFYFGSAASHGFIPELFNKKKFIINSTDHLELTNSFSENNFILFKNIYSLKTNSLIKLEELFQKNLMSFENISKATDNGEIKLIENTEEEILESLIEFYEYNFKEKKIDNVLNKKYFELRNEYLLKNYNSLNIDLFNKIKCTISNKYLSNNL